MRFYGLAVLVGAFAGLIGTLFHLAVDALLAVHDRLAGAMDVVPAIAISVPVATVMIIASVFVVRRYAPETAGSGIQEIEGAMDGLRPLRWRRVLPVKFFAGLLSLGSGMVAGREGPTVHMGAAVAAAVAEQQRLDWVETRGLYAAGAAAGLAAAFNAPLAAVLFVIEETRRQFPFTFRTYTGVIIASGFSTIITQEIAGVGPDLSIHAPELPLVYLIGFAILGALLGAFGVLFNRLLLLSLDLADRIGKISPYIVPAAVGVLIGVLLVLLPSATQGGERLILSLVTTEATLAGLFLLVAVRLVTTMASYSTGAPGGIFAPILTLATCTGLALGALTDVVLPGEGHATVAFAVAAMGGLFAATVRAPLVGVVLVLELTGAFDMLLAVLVTCVVANLMAERLGGRPIYEELLERTLRLSGQKVPTAPQNLPVELGWQDRQAQNDDADKTTGDDAPPPSDGRS